MAETSLSEALQLAEDLVVESSDGTKWIRVEALKELEAKRRTEQIEEQVAPRPKSYDQAKSLAFQDSELRGAFPDPTPVVGPSPPAA